MGIKLVNAMIVIAVKVEHSLSSDPKVVHGGWSPWHKRVTVNDETEKIKQ
jgi:hypothetical protein